MLPLVRGETAEWPEEVFIQVSESQVGRAVRTQRWKYSIVAPNKDGNRDSTSDHYVEECLYCMETDPYELTNLIGLASHQEVAAIMRERLIRRMAEAGEATPIIDPAPARPSGQYYVSPVDARS
jgi:arylsulfatase A-like enzyme